MTRADHSRRVAYVVRVARSAARRGKDLGYLARRVNMPPQVLPRYLRRHGADDVVDALVAARSQ